MRRFSIIWGIAAVVLALCVPAYTQTPSSGRYGPEYQECAKLSTQGIVECVAAKTKAWDRKLKCCVSGAADQAGLERAAQRPTRGATAVDLIPGRQLRILRGWRGDHQPCCRR